MAKYLSAFFLEKTITEGRKESTSKCKITKLV